ncbi:MAG: hypothetical protein Q9203_005758 [Teloschistes exilis]
MASLFTLTFLLTILSLARAHPGRYAATESAEGTGTSPFRSFFSFRTPSALFPSSAIISLTDDNSTFFLARPADFGPNLPSDGLSGQLWVGSGFNDDHLGRGLAAETEGELGCSDVPGWQSGKKHHQGDSPFEPSNYVSMPTSSGRVEDSGSGEHIVSDLRNHRDQDGRGPSRDDGTDDHLHHPLPSSHISKTRSIGRSADFDTKTSGQPPQHADIQSLQESAEIAGKLVLLSRGGCGFLEKVKWVQRRGGAGLIVGDNTRGGALVTMYARGDTSNISIPALFTSRTTAHLLSSLIPLEDDDILTTSSKSYQPLAAGTTQTTNSELGNDRPTFTPIRSAPKSTSITPLRSSAGKPKDTKVKQPQQHRGIGGFIRSLFGLTSQKGTSYHVEGAQEDDRRPSSSGHLKWINEEWTDSAIKPGNDNKAMNKVPDDKKSDQSIQHRPGDLESPGDGFEIGVHDWRDPDLVRGAADGLPTSTSSTSNTIPISTGSPGPVDSDPGNATPFSGGSITPSSGEYQQPNINLASHSEPLSGSSQEDDIETNKRSWLGRMLRGSRRDPIRGKHGEAQAEHWLRKGMPVQPDNHPLVEIHEGLWITLTPTTMSTSPFFDTLLVLVVSPLITLTVVYSLLLIRSRIRRRRWRAPKSVVDRLPIRTYHTMSCSSTTSSSQLATPRTSSPTSPLLQSRSRSAIGRSRPRSHTASSVGDAVAESLDKATARASLKQRNAAAGSSPKDRSYHGKQVECVVCLEEYIDGQSKVMRLPCGHEFHAECITPWLTTRRRTCPICKGDVVRSLAKPAGRSSSHLAPSGNPSAGEDVQVQAAESTNDSPTAAIPIPRDGADVEQGDDMATTLVNDPPEASSSRPGWRGVASLSLSAFSGEATWRQAQADRNR